MKTREELLNQLGQLEGYFDELEIFQVLAKDYSADAVDRILSAPTQAQLDCPYCHGGRKAKPIVEEQFSFLAFDKNGIVALGNDGSVTTGEDYERFMFCPMCGRKLEE